MATPSPLSMDREYIRGTATWMAGLAWIIIFFIARYFAEPVWRAFGLSAVQASLALAAWWGYHLLSRRNDGIVIFFLFATNGAMRYSRPELPLANELALHLITGGFTIVMTLLLGLAVRLASKKKAPPAKTPLWDNELDHLMIPAADAVPKGASRSS